MERLLARIKQCNVCAQQLELGSNPVVQASRKAKLLIVGQAPGLKVHQSSIPWNDPSGDRLRSWLNLDKHDFYDSSKIAIVPMGFCYPGKGKTGDLPPRSECAPLWHEQLLGQMPNVGITLLIGQYAQRYYLSERKSTLTDTVRNWSQWAPKQIPMPHPSPRNAIWLKKNPWFEKEVVPYIRKYVHDHLKG
ncbi:uracil-DNA glycosylase family protein [Vibrio sp. 10N.261.55.A7]|uniref:uracil-DNA glycosylase family protein n=1 Tax=Vibrio sp. 10N.261.55.A7 TaxID=1880851 RepID=UPI000C83854E|nr:uracil-DNA glycosylase family protein [Vibrio sp. 10N.261.55.A7]PMJ96704.1 IclR family transcriptional regulator [Vibrio sp. 10N.261.55.A7]